MSAHQNAPPPPVVEGKPLAGIRLLVVEDDAVTLTAIRIALTRSGAEVKTAMGAKDALLVLESWRPDLLLSDIGLPGEDGYALMRKVRALAPEKGGTIPAVAVTAYAREEERRMALAAGYQMHLPKPIDPDHLVAVVLRAVQEGRRQDRQS